MYIIGITGPTGAGKSIAMHALDDYGALALDCDDIYHKLLETNTEMTNEIKSHFYDKDILSSGEIDRKKLGHLVWENSQALEDLNAITHKYVTGEIEQRIAAFENQGGEIVIISAIALIESDYSDKCNSVVCITAPENIRQKRITRRDNISRDDASARINAQKSEDFYKKNSDYTLENTDENIEDFLARCRRAFLIEKWFFDNENNLISDLGKFVEINSVYAKAAEGAPYGRAPREALQLAEDMLKDNGFDAAVFKDMVITADFGPKPAKLGILTHLDIVEAGERWDTDPFKMTNIEGRLYGRGVADDKGPAVASMYALYCVRDLFPDLQHGVELIFGSSEEIGFDDIAQYARENNLPPNVFSPDSEFPVVNIEKGRFLPYFGASFEKDETLPRIISVTGGRTPNIIPGNAVAVIEGFCIDDINKYIAEYEKKTGVKLSAVDKENKITITAAGNSAHAGRPYNGNNAQTALIEMLAAMPFANSRSFSYIKTLARLFPHGDYSGSALNLAAKDDISGETTVSFNVLQFDERGFSANFDARTALCADEKDISEITKNVLERDGITVSRCDIKPGHHTPEETEFVQTLMKIYENHTGDKGKCICMGGLTYVHDIPGGVAFGCSKPGEDNNVHGPNEYIDKAWLIKCAKIFTHAIIDICK